jgi:hypothetical protein
LDKVVQYMAAALLAVASLGLVETVLFVLYGQAPHDNFHLQMLIQLVLSVTWQ